MSGNPFVTTDWLAARLADDDIVIVDGSWHMPALQRNAAAEFEASHIPGSVFFDIDSVADRTTNLPHMLPTPDDFGRMAGELGIGSDKSIVVYDQVGLGSAARVWWTFRVMGARDVKILQGGSPRWKAENKPMETGPARKIPARFTARFHPELVRNFDDVLEIVRNGGATIVDARPAGRFTGEAPEPRVGLASGHIPKSLNVPVTELSRDGVMKNPDELRALFKEAGVDLHQPIVTSCGSGVTASTLALALGLAGARDVAVYDGSWTEWGSRADAPVER